MLNQSMTRSDIAPAYTWLVTSVYRDDDLWETEFARVVEVLPSLEALRGSLGTTATQLLHALTLRDSVAADIDRLMLYASLRYDEDTTQADQQARADRATQLLGRFGTATAFFRSEILGLPEAVIAQLGLTQLRACAPMWLAQSREAAFWVQRETAGPLDE